MMQKNENILDQKESEENGGALLLESNRGDLLLESHRGNPQLMLKSPLQALER